VRVTKIAMSIGSIGGAEPPPATGTRPAGRNTTQKVQPQMSLSLLPGIIRRPWSACST
jgi:hypothetical protein